MYSSAENNSIRIYLQGLSYSICLWLIAMLITVVPLHGQNIKKMTRKASKGVYHPGTLKLNSGKVIISDFYYDIRSGIVFQKVGKEVVPYTASNTTYFKIKTDHGQKKYFSIPYDVFERGQSPHVFFEVLYEKNNTAVLKNYVVQYKSREVKIPTSITPANTVQPGELNYTVSSPTGFLPSEGGRSVQEKVYLVNGEDGIKPFLSIKTSLFDALDNDNERTINRDKLSGKIIDKKLLNEFFGIHYEKVMGYAEEQKLKIKKVDDLIKIMDYYVSLREG